jgi:ribonuclease P protein component
MTVLAMPPTPVSAQDAGVVVSAQRFPRVARVRAKAEFTAVFDGGRRTAEPRMALHWLADAAPARLGLAVSRKVDPNAVGRNRIKRALREAFRHLRGRLPGGAYVVVARSGAAQADGPALRDALERLLQRAGALPPPPPAGTMPPANLLPSDDAAPSRGPSLPA